MNLRNKSDQELRETLQNLIKQAFVDNKALMVQTLSSQGFGLLDLVELASMVSSLLTQQLDSLVMETEDQLLPGHRASLEETQELLQRLSR